MPTVAPEPGSGVETAGSRLATEEERRIGGDSPRAGEHGPQEGIRRIAGARRWLSGEAENPGGRGAG
ncbi:hypothetical protein GCM10007079_09320 [Nocardiopsis terrae]|uniref:Uncharacterized protein n=1 Tax=Nocardiopsis terrae TaxID=372655 RepID=A0ABR9HCT9_9ACTN|nr:hypothetical protein [Nocardiopsis terrae]GHC74785.1 hypothetical protein GCM10007079_09320 [Nocardiopsis terrae]